MLGPFLEVGFVAGIGLGLSHVYYASLAPPVGGNAYRLLCDTADSQQGAANSKLKQMLGGDSDGVMDVCVMLDSMWSKWGFLCSIWGCAISWKSGHVSK